MLHECSERRNHKQAIVIAVLDAEEFAAEATASFKQHRQMPPPEHESCEPKPPEARYDNENEV